ncbi:putative leader peptide [Pilimelia anulata]
MPPLPGTTDHPVVDDVGAGALHRVLRRHVDLLRVASSLCPRRS